MSSRTTVGRKTQPAWVTRAEAAFIAKVPLARVDEWISTGRLTHRRVGGTVLVDSAELRAVAARALPVRPPVEPVRAHVEPGPVRPRIEPVQPPVEPLRPRVGPLSPTTEPARPLVEPVASRTEQVSPSTEPVRPPAEPPPPSVDVARPAAEQTPASVVEAPPPATATEEAAPPPPATVEAVELPAEPLSPSLEAFEEPVEPSSSSLEAFEEPVEPSSPSLDVFGEPLDPSVDLFGEPLEPSLEPLEPSPSSEPAPSEPDQRADPASTRVERIRPPVEARSVRGARARTDRSRPRTRHRPRRTTVVAVVAAAAAVALFTAQQVLFPTTSTKTPIQTPSPEPSPASPTPATIPIGRDPFASPFGPSRSRNQDGVLVKPPGVVRQGGALIPAATVINRSDTRWLPPSEVTFVARDDIGRVIGRTTTTVTLGPDDAQTVVAPALDVDPSAVAAIEAHLDAAPLRPGRYRPPPVSVTRAVATDGGKAIQGTLDVGPRAGSQARLACAMFDSLDELTSVSETTVDLSRAQHGQLRFWLTAQPAAPGPYHVSCSAS